MLIRYLPPAVAVAFALAVSAPAHAEKLKCKVQLDDGLPGDAGDDDAARLVLEIDHAGGKAQVKVGTLTSTPKLKFKDVKVVEKDGRLVFDATPANAVDTEAAGCHTRQYYYHLSLAREAQRLRGELVVTPFYKRGDAKGKCKNFAAPEIVSDHHRNLLCLVAAN